MNHQRIIIYAILALAILYPMGECTSNHNVIGAASSTPAPPPRPKPKDPEPPVWADKLAT